MAAKKPKKVPLRKPPTAADAAAFAAGGTTPLTTPSTIVPRVRAGLMRRLTVYMPVDKARAFRTRCAEKDRTISDVLTELAEKWVAAK